MTPPLHVLHLIEDLGSGGAERLLYTNLAHFDRTRFEGVVCHVYDRNEFWNEAIRSMGYPVVNLGCRSIYDLGRGLVRLLDLLRREPVDLIHTHLFGANVLGRVAGRIRRIPVLSSLHCPDYEPTVLQDNPRMSRAKLNALRLLDRLSCGFADPHFVSVSDYVKQSSVRHLGLSPDRIPVIYNAVAPQAFEPAATDHARLRDELTIPPHASVILCVARFNPQKGVRYLIEAVPLVLEKETEVCFIFVGATTPDTERPFRQFLDRHRAASHVRILGIQTDVRPFLRLCDIFVLPSLAEGLGIALVEAMAMERACISTRVSAIPEVVADGRSGLLVEPANPRALADAILRLLANPSLRDRMGVEGRRIVLERFDIHHNISQLQTLYCHILGRPADRPAPTPSAAPTPL